MKISCHATAHFPQIKMNIASLGALIATVVGASICDGVSLSRPFRVFISRLIVTISDSTALCYNIRYFEQHGRDLEDPWSCRQSAVHHSFSTASEQSTWVIIQAPEAFKVVSDWGQHFMSLHIGYLRAGIANWRQYLEYFAQRFRNLVSRVRDLNIELFPF